jgi:hypothetical protein
MNLSEEIVLGEVRQLTNRNDTDIRVIAVDNGEVLYDVSYHASPSWMFVKARGKCYYYRHRVDRLVRESSHVRHQPLTDDERARFRPDLPISFLRRLSTNWGFAAGCAQASFAERARSLGLDIDSMPGLPVPQVMLYAARLRASSRGVLCTAENRQSMSALELLWHGHQIQETRGYRCGPGIGLFRMGHEKGGVPSYLVGGCNELPSAGPIVA